LLTDKQTMMKTYPPWWR